MLDATRACCDCGATEGMDWWRSKPGYASAIPAQTRCRPCYNEYQRIRYHARRGRIAPPIRRATTSPPATDVRECIDCGDNFVRKLSPVRCPDCVGTNRSAAQAKRSRAERAGDRGIHWTTLGARNGWQCHICHAEVAQFAGTAHEPFGATVDHLVPVALGGSHTWDNVALAHRRCNILRGTDVSRRLLVERR